MRTRNQAKRKREEGEQTSDISGESRCKNLIRPMSYKESAKEIVKRCTSLVEAKMTHIISKGSEQGAILSDGNIKETIVGEQDAGASISCALPMTGKDTGEPDWEDGTVSNSYFKLEDDPLDLCGTDMTIEFSESPSSAQQRTIRRASSEDKILAELVHKVHLLCLLARGRLVDSACDDPLIQASLLSLVPSRLLKITDIPKLTISELVPLIHWFRANFHVQSSGTKEGDFKSNLSLTLGTQEGTAEEVAALSVALFRALNLSARFVSILDVASLKPDADVPGSSKEDVPRLDTKIASSSSKIMASPNQASTPLVQPSSRKPNHMEVSPGTVQRGMHETKVCNLACANKYLNSPPVTTVLNNETMDSSNNKSCNDMEVHTHAKNSRRKGDIEFDMQLEMALSATAMLPQENNSSTKMDDTSVSLEKTSSFKKLKKTERRESSVLTQESVGAVWSRKSGPPLYWAEVYCSGETLSGRWVHVDAANGIIDGEQQTESAFAACRKLLKYVVAFAGFGAKDVTRRYCIQWYKIASQRVKSSWWDAVLTPLKQLESAATGGIICSEVYREDASAERWIEPIELTGPGCIFSDESSQMHAKHLDLAAGIQREMREENGSKICLRSPSECYMGASRESLEDMELETRALTEPLPTNQLAYRNHHLYVIERWLTKYQILHPKGPVLGYCSGHPVYPRACVQMLQTKRKWLREGMQVKANEVPAKVVKLPQKLDKGFTSESCAFEEDNDKSVIELYGKWQVEPLCLPPAVDGVVPKNERGQVEVWSEKCLPPGTIHLRLPRVIPVAKRLEVDFAPAMVGFEFRNGRSYPIFEGIVVCTEFRDAILEAYAEEEERREAEEKKRSEAQALLRWYQLLCSIITRQRLKNTYEDVPQRTAEEWVNDSSSAPDSSHEVVMVPRRQQQASLEAARQDSLPRDHEHVFPIEYQSFDEDSSVRTKRCPCGFSIQMEEL